MIGPLPNILAPMWLVHNQNMLDTLWLVRSQCLLLFPLWLVNGQNGRRNTCKKVTGWCVNWLN